MLLPFLVVETDTHGGVCLERKVAGKEVSALYIFFNSDNYWTPFECRFHKNLQKLHFRDIRKFFGALNIKHVDLPLGYCEQIHLN